MTGQGDVGQTGITLDSTQAIPQPTLRGGLRPDECEILLIRHGRSADVVPGSPESADPSLHVVGVEQAERLAERLSSKTIHAVYSSHLARAVQTATPLAVPRGLTVDQHVDLEEIRLGDWANGEFRRRAAIQDPEWVAWSRTGRWDGIPGGEGDDAFRGRTSALIERLVAGHGGETIAVVAHGGTINVILSWALEVHRTLWATIENTSISTLLLGPDGPTVVGINDCHHLFDPVLARG